MKIHQLLYIGMALLLAACSSDDNENDGQTQPKRAPLVLTSSINNFEGDVTTRTNLAGTDFETDDKIKLKIICPYTSATMVGETTWGNGFDALWLLKWKSNNWALLENSDSVDITSRYSYGYNNIFREFEAQNTPYIYTASTWCENTTFLAPNGSSSLTRYSQYNYIFHANQSKLQNYKKSDLLWAQTYMQTGSYNVHLTFNHVMACLKITLPASLETTAVVTVEGMPDIDQKEVVVGDYYAHRSKVNTKYGYQEKCKCEYANNGKVLGVAIVNDEQAKSLVYRINGSPEDANTLTPPIADDGVYTAYNAGSHVYYLIVPPCTLTDDAKVLIRDGEKRYSYQLKTETLTEFEQGKRYSLTIQLP